MLRLFSTFAICLCLLPVCVAQDKPLSFQETAKWADEPLSLQEAQNWADDMDQALIDNFWGASFKEHPRRYFFNKMSRQADMATNDYWPQAHAIDAITDAYERTKDENIIGCTIFGSRECRDSILTRVRAGKKAILGGTLLSTIWSGRSGVDTHLQSDGRDALSEQGAANVRRLDMVAVGAGGRRAVVRGNYVEDRRRQIEERVFQRAGRHRRRPPCAIGLRRRFERQK